MVGLTLIDAQTLQAVLPLTPDMVLAPAQLPSDLNLRADTSPSEVGSVRFDCCEKLRPIGASPSLKRRT